MAFGFHITVSLLFVLPIAFSAVNFNSLHQHFKLPIPTLKAQRSHNEAPFQTRNVGGGNKKYENLVHNYNGHDETIAESLLEQPYLEQETEDDCSIFPNNTDIAPHYFTCSTRSPALLFIHDAAITNSTGDDQFPVDFSQELRFFFDVTSYASRRYDNLGVEVTVYKRSTGWLGCGWLYIPSFGLISDFHMCDDNPSCPVVPGRQVLEVTINPSLLFAGFFKMFHNDQVPYQLTMRIRNNRLPAEELLCVTYQMRIHY